MSEGTSPQSSRRGLLAAAIIGALVIIVAVGIAVSHLSGSPHTITVDGESIVTVESKRDAKAVLDRLRASALDNTDLQSVRFAQEVRYRPAAEDAELADVSEALSALEQVVTMEVVLFCVVVDNVPIVGLADRGDTEEALERLKGHYDKMIQSRDVESQFRENVFIDKRFVSPSIGRPSVEEAVRALTSPAEGPVYHSIVRGDRVARLAQDYGVSFPELQKLNPDTNLDRIVEGDRLLIRRAKPPITVVSRAMVTRTVTVTPPSGAGRQSAQRVGKRELEILEVYENGEKVSEEIKSQRTTWGSL